MPTHQFQMTYADYDVPPEQGAAFCDELLEELLDHQPDAEWIEGPGPKAIGA